MILKSRPQSTPRILSRPTGSGFGSVVLRSPQKRKLGHASAKVRKLPSLVESTIGDELLEGRTELIWGRGIEEVEVKRVVDTKRLEEEEESGEVGAMNLWRLRVHHCLEMGLVVETVG